MGVQWDVDDGPRAGDIILAASKNPKWAIYATLQLITGAPSMYTHAALCLDSETYLDPRPGGAQIRPIRDLQERSAVAFSRNLLSTEQREAIVDVARDYLDSPYTFWRFGYLAGKTFRLGARALEHLDRRCKGATICSELILRAYAEAGVSFGPWALDPREASPGTLARIGTWSHYQTAPLALLEPPVKLA